MRCCGECAFKHINQGSIFLDDWRISAYFDTKFVAVVLVEPILHKFEDLKIADIFNLKEVYFLVTRVTYAPQGCCFLPSLKILLAINLLAFFCSDDRVVSDIFMF